MNTKIISLLLVFISFTGIMKAQFEVDGEFRTRTIADHGYTIPVLNDAAATFSVDQRTRINIKYRNSKLTSFISLQDSRIWGDDNLITKAGAWGNSNSFAIHEAWVSLKLGSATNLKFGRQEFNYDNMRLLSYRNWATSALSYDAALLQTNSESLKLSLDIGLSYNNNSDAMTTIDNSNWQPDKLKTLNFIYLKKEINQNSYLSLISSLSGKSDTANNAILGTGTYGFVAVINHGKQSKAGVFAMLETYYQHGTDLKRGSDGNYKNIVAYMLVSELGFRSSNKKLELKAGFELLSGHDYSNTNTDYKNTRHTFDLLYGGRLPYYGGYLNHFKIQDSYLVGTKGGGYFDPYFKVKYKINKKNILETGIFMPQLNTPVRAHTAINPSYNKPMGAETDSDGNAVFWEGSLGKYFDINYTLKLSNEIIIKSGMSYALPSAIKNQMVYGYNNIQNKTLHKLGQNYFGWLTIVIKPTFFNNNTSNQ